MKILWGLIAGAFVATVSWANTNPLMRVCRLEQGRFWTLQVPGDELPLCFFGKAAVGAESLLQLESQAGDSEAVKAYKSASGGDCSTLGAENLEGVDSNGVSFKVCRFADSSLIEENTLKAGFGHPSNQKLDQVLSKW